MNLPSEPAPSNPSSRPVAWGLALAVAVLSVGVRLLPDDWKWFNFHPLGALALFAGARLRPWAACLLPLGTWAVSDLLLFWTRGYPGFSPLVGGCFALYAALGMLALRRSDAPVRIGLCALGASTVFFLVTNFGAWLGQALPYGYTLGGLGQCYAMGLPFHKGILLGDLGFSAGLFGAYALATRGVLGTARVPQGVQA